jgi:hypothetical protein
MTTTKRRKRVRFLGTKLATAGLALGGVALLYGGLAIAGPSTSDDSAARADAAQEPRPRIIQVVATGSGTTSGGTAVQVAPAAPPKPKPVPTQKPRKSRGS